MYTHTLTHTPAAIFTHKSPVRRGSADSSPATEDKKTSVKSVKRVLFILWETCSDLAHWIKKTKKLDWVVEKIMLDSKKKKNVADFSTLSLSSQAVQWPSNVSPLMWWTFPRSWRTEAQRANKKPFGCLYSEIIVCMCVRTDGLTFVQCKVKWCFAAGDEGDLVSQVAHSMLRFMTPQNCWYSEKRGEQISVEFSRSAVRSLSLPLTKILSEYLDGELQPWWFDSANVTEICTKSNLKGTPFNLQLNMS